MVDVVDRATRSRMMSGIRGRDTKPELVIRSALHNIGFRFRLHAKNLPGRPDLVLPKYKVAVFVHGCFWHGHLGCQYFVKPKTRPDFWLDKINGNALRDKQSYQLLRAAGWHVLVVWECALKSKVPLAVLVDRISSFVLWAPGAESDQSGSESRFEELAGFSP